MSQGVTATNRVPFSMGETRNNDIFKNIGGINSNPKYLLLISASMPRKLSGDIHNSSPEIFQFEYIHPPLKSHVVSSGPTYQTCVFAATKVVATNVILIFIAKDKPSFE